jgi:hypothetical protein
MSAGLRRGLKNFCSHSILNQGATSALAICHLHIPARSPAEVFALRIKLRDKNKDLDTSNEQTCQRVRVLLRAERR